MRRLSSILRAARTIERLIRCALCALKEFCGRSGSQATAGLEVKGQEKLVPLQGRGRQAHVLPFQRHPNYSNLMVANKTKTKQKQNP